MFFGLDAFKLKLVFNRYEREHGEGKRKYAEQTFAKWKSGKVRMGGAISERIICIVPSFLSFDQKYELVSKLWSRLRGKQNLSVTIHPASDIDSAIDAVMDIIEAEQEREIPEAVAARLDWLSSNDGVVAQELLGQVERREAEIATQTLGRELEQLLDIARRHTDKNVSASRRIELPTARVTVSLSQFATQFGRSPTMTDKPHDEGEDNSKELARQSEHKNKPTSIQNPNDLLGEALKNMSSKKQEEIIGKATDEALRLQVKQREGHLDHEMASSKVGGVADAAHRLGSTGHEFEVSAEHRSEHGSVNVSVRSKKDPLTKRVGGCFIATAAYDNFDHPSVVELRRFRDSWLRCYPRGRQFIAYYYRNGPLLARHVKGRPILQISTRLILAPIVCFVRLLNTYKIRQNTRDRT